MTITTIRLAAVLAASLISPAAAGDWAPQMPDLQLNDVRGNVPIFGGGSAFSKWESDCQYLTFRHGDHPSAQISLNSSLVERQTYTDESGQQRHRDNIVQRNSRTISFERRGGDLAPWERDRFRVCLKGHDYWAEESDTAYSYSMQMGMNGMVVATAGSKYRTQADSDGLYAKSFGQEGGAGGFKFVIGDKWTRYYGAGEEVAIHVELKKDTWTDETILEKTFTFPSAESYTIDFSQYAHEMNKDFENGNEYFVKWSFQRIGNVSTDTRFSRNNTKKSAYNSGNGKVEKPWQPW